MKRCRISYLSLPIVTLAFCILIGESAAYAAALPEHWRFETPMPDYVGGRATALGNAYTAVAEGATAGFWNPAGLIQAPGVALFGQTKLNRRHEWAFDPKGIRFCYRRWAFFWGNKIALRLPGRTPDYNAYALAHQLSERAAVGIAFSFERRHPWETYQWFGIHPRAHLSVLAYPSDGLRIGLVSHGTQGVDVGLAWEKKGWLLPLRVRWNSENTEQEAAPADSPFGLHLGAEKVFWKDVTARVGMSAGSPTAGIGWKWHSFHIDYAWIREHDQSNHFLSLEIAR